jgi:hypothetical protein
MARAWLLLFPLAALSCAGPSEMERDLAQARETLAALERAALSARPEIPEALRPARDLPGDAAPEILEALAEYGGGRRPADPARDVTRAELDPSRDTAAFAAFADAPPVHRLLAASRRERCRLTGAALPLSPDLVDTETLSTEALLKWTFAIVERARALEEGGDPAGAERALLGALSLGSHLEDDPGIAVAMAGRAVQEEAAFYLARFYGRTGQTAKRDAARALGEDLARFGRYWVLAAPLAALCLDPREAPAAARRAAKAGNLALACETAAAVALCYFRNGSEREDGPSAGRFEALEILRQAFPDPVLGEAARLAEGMLAWRPERIEAFLAEFLPRAKVYR